MGLLQCPAFAPIFCPELLLVDARDYLARCPETWLVESRYRLPEFLNRCSACLSLHRRHCRCCGIPRVALRFVSRSNIIRCTWIALTLAIEHEHRLKCRAHSCLNFFSYCRRYNRTPMGWVPMPLCFISLFSKKVDLHSHGTCCWAEDVGLHAVGVPNFCL